MVCILINYALAPVSSSKRPALSAAKRKRFKWISTGILTVFFFILLITPENEYMVSGFWVIILHAVQLSCAAAQKKNMHCISSYRAGKEYLMNTQTETISPVKVLLEQLARLTEWNGGSAPSIFLFGEIQFPKKSDYYEKQ